MNEYCHCGENRQFCVDCMKDDIDDLRDLISEMCVVLESLENDDNSIPPTIWGMVQYVIIKGQRVKNV